MNLWDRGKEVKYGLKDVIETKWIDSSDQNTATERYNLFAEKKSEKYSLIQDKISRGMNRSNTSLDISNARENLRTIGFKSNLQILQRSY